ncbi:MAG: winged helix-turn-helix domain-containing protein [Rhodocyclaceae bacterium]|nr:winged helix-turn-helix domain-containing protein [Rhodocyclaceae bacterium]MBX3668083.1 winged helix-turn-helix domain-containing protein [Rhodocyclaceae bacterium]
MKSTDYSRSSAAAADPVAETEPPRAAAARYRIGQFTLDPATNELLCEGQIQRLEPKAVEVLARLAGRAGEVFAREELLEAVWPGVVVGDDALTQVVIKLRKALGDDARRPAYIETISKRGYRLIAPVAVEARPAAEAVALPPDAAGSGHDAAPVPDAVQQAGQQAPPAAALSQAPVPAAVRPRVTARWLAGLALLCLLAGLFWLWRAKQEGGSGAGAPYPVIAVLPLANQSADPARDYFCDGVSEDIIAALGRYSALRVIAFNSVARYKQQLPSVQAVGRELGARYVLAGSLREEAGRTRIAVELSDAGNAQVLWNGRYEGEDVLEIRDRIVQQIAGTLAAKLNRLEERRSSTKPVHDMQAYDLVLRARALIVRSERGGNREARSLLARARELAPDYAPIYVLLAQAEFNRSMNGWNEDSTEGFVRAEEYAKKALAIDDPEANARAHGVLALIYGVRREFARAVAEGDQAIKLNPSDAYAIDTRGDALLWSGQLEPALQAFEASRQVDPAGRSSGGAFDYVLVFYSLHRYAEALNAVDLALARNPDAHFLLLMRAITLAQMGKTEDARAAAESFRRAAPYFPIAQFGDRFTDPKITAHLQEGLRKAGL